MKLKKLRRKRNIRRFGWLMFWIALISLLAYGYNEQNKKEVVLVEQIYVDKIVEPELPPVMKRIAICESGDKHYGESGQVLMIGNTNKSVDVGRYQINTLWFDEATAMGLDLTDEEDNETFALHLYHTRGTVDWIWSKKCWNK